ncbi:MAG: ATPase, T2SS/T4P/T4SS family [Candidatus Electryonea clarkiae]|nr:ATPase, T2SS/T4P/T4SS family [Candidatus Electryonea clarkiae]MDP8288685.1 ATPase, T2SS/T4P/T4SS family [Candidatus Electryonea clarkiae]
MAELSAFPKLGEILVAEGFIEQEQLDRSLAESEEKNLRIGEVLIALGFAMEEHVYLGLAKQMGVPFYSSEQVLEGKEDIVRIVPEAFAKENSLIAVKLADETLTIAMADPDDIIAIDNLRKLTDEEGLKLELAMGSPQAIQHAIGQLYVRIRKQQETSEVIGDLKFFTESDEGDEGMVDMTKEHEDTDAPIIKLVNLIIGEALKERATDIHIEPREDHVVVRYRVDGVLLEVMKPPRNAHNGIVARVKIISKLNIAEKRLPQDGRFTIKAKDREVDVRVSILPTVNGEKIVLRLLDKGTFGFTLATLGFEDHHYKLFKRNIIKPYGLIIVSGPTGSGKSTSLYASLREVMSVQDNITTVEDPVEYHLDGINQVQVKPRIGLTFASSLRSILRQDPDRLLIGEIRDEETADIAIKFSLTGHLVFTTVHANDAPSTVTRLIDIGVPPFLCGSSLLLVMAQRLVRTLCPNCKTEYEPTETELDYLDLNPEDIEGVTWYKGRGCVHCRDTGYYGRTGIFELLPVTHEIRRLIYDNSSQDEIRELAEHQGMETLRQQGISKAKRGMTSLAEILRVTTE